MSAPANNGCGRGEALLEYALELLPADEAADLAAHVAACPECARELAALQPTAEAFTAWPTDVLRPPKRLWERLAQRVGRNAAAETVPSPARWAEPEWEQAAPGITVKLLASDPERHRVSMLVRLAPKTAYPPHRHAGVEELHLLDGELMIEDRKLRPGDYNLGQAGAVDNYVYSETGCTCILVTSTKDELR